MIRASDVKYWKTVVKQFNNVGRNGPDQEALQKQELSIYIRCGQKLKASEEWPA